MSEQAAGDNPGDSAAQAFEALRQEVECLRLGLAALEIPDYSVTLGKILQTSQITSGDLKALAEMPALRLSTSGWSREIAAAGLQARHADHAALESARGSFERAAIDLTSSLRSVRTADHQRQWLVWTNIASFFAGVCFWALSMGPLLRAVPESWHWQEHVAARLMDMREEEAGAHLIATATPDRWRDIVLGYRLITKNRDAIAACQRGSELTRKPVSCAILIQDPASE